MANMIRNIIRLFAALSVLAARSMTNLAGAQTQVKAQGSVPLSPDDEQMFVTYLQNVADLSEAVSCAYIDAVAAGA